MRPSSLREADAAMPSLHMISGQWWARCHGFGTGPASTPLDAMTVLVRRLAEVLVAERARPTVKVASYGEDGTAGELVLAGGAVEVFISASGGEVKANSRTQIDGFPVDAPIEALSTPALLVEAARLVGAEEW